MGIERTGIVEEAKARRERFAHLKAARCVPDIIFIPPPKRALPVVQAIEPAPPVARPEPKPRAPMPHRIAPVEDIIDAVATASGQTSRLEILGPCQAFSVVRPRHVAMLLVFELRPDLSLPTLGQIFSRDHTSVMHGRDKARERIEAGEASAFWYRDARAALGFE